MTNMTPLSRASRLASAGVAIVGAGPAGLTAAVYAASEGLSVADATVVAQIHSLLADAR
jgi:ribulose 1,5-bisphosphate synthetase/thiazole synthase